MVVAVCKHGLFLFCCCCFYRYFDCIFVVVGGGGCGLDADAASVGCSFGVP